MTALVLANEVLRKFGGDSMRELVRNAEGFALQVHEQSVATGVVAEIDPEDRPIKLGRVARVRRPEPHRRARGPRRGRLVSRPAPHQPGHVVLVGMMGVGKTTVGTRLAEALGRPFADSDAMIEARTGRTVREIFEADGEPVFRALESECLAESLESTTPTVIAAAGGVVLDPANRALLRRAATVVWLRAPVSVLVDRVASGEHRPAVEVDPEGTLSRMEEARSELYAEVADVVVDSSRPVPEVVAQVIAAVEQREAAA